MSLYEIQSKLHVGKDKVNSFGGYNYRTAEGILAAVKPLLPEGASVVLSDTIQEVAGQIFLVAEARLTLADGTSFAATSPALHPLTKKGMDPSQISGAASSYARKYALCGLFAIDDSEGDPDAAKANYEPDHSNEIDTVKAILRNLTTMQNLQDYWVNLDRDKRHIAALPDVIEAKNRRKAELENANA